MYKNIVFVLVLFAFIGLEAAACWPNGGCGVPKFADGQNEEQEQRLALVQREGAMVTRIEDDPYCTCLSCITYPVVCPLVVAGTVAVCPSALYKAHYKPGKPCPMAIDFVASANHDVLETVLLGCEAGQVLCCIYCGCCEKIKQEFALLMKPMEEEIAAYAVRRMPTRQVTMQ